MGVTLKDIAKELNLSKTTVSFVLSGLGDQKGISPRTQKRILDYTKSINFQPNLLARSLISGKSHTIGVVVPSIGDTFYAELVQDIEQAAKKRGYIIVICSSERDKDQERRMIRNLRANQVDGLIIAPTEYAREEIGLLEKDNFPFVLVDRYFPDVKTNYVVADDREATLALVNDMLGKGRRKIAFITPDTGVTAVKLRKAAYREAMERSAAGFDPALVREVRRDDYQVHIVEVMDRLLGDVPDLDAMIFATHYLAQEAVLYLYKRRIDIDRFALACFHGNEVVKALAPHMAIARVPLEGFAGEAVEVILDCERAAGEKVQKVIPSSISTG